MPKGMAQSHYSIGHNSGEKSVPETQVIVQAYKPILECLHQITGKHLWFLLNLPTACCRQIENMELEIRKSEPTRERANVYISRCVCCKAKHHRMMADTGKIGGSIHG